MVEQGKLKIEIDLSNAAFEDNARLELESILTRLRERTGWASGANRGACTTATAIT